MIAHRVTTLENCDLPLMLEDGRLIDSTSDVSSAVRHMLPFDSLESVIHAGTADS
jgi:ABC-type bacteriocin/lantibiotic exporter with double-glycine peptidase domain